MFEFDKYDKRLHKTRVAPPKSQMPNGPPIKKLSLLMWGEHCIECAAPDCFRTCDLYDRRSDSQCRRFVFGAFKNHQHSSPRGYGVELVDVAIPSKPRYLSVVRTGEAQSVSIRDGILYAGVWGSSEVVIVDVRGVSDIILSKSGAVVIRLNLKILITFGDCHLGKSLRRNKTSLVLQCGGISLE